MKLIGSLNSPYTRKVRLVMAEKKIEYKLEMENVWAADTKIKEYNPLGKIPCLVMEDGEVLFDSRVICEYVDTLTPVGKMIPPSGRERAAVRCWEALADGMTDAGIAIRLEESQREPAERSSKWVARQWGKVHDSVALMDRNLGDNGWCASNHLTLADISLGCALGFVSFRMPDYDWRKSHPNLARHYDKLMQRQSFIDTMPA